MAIHVPQYTPNITQNPANSTSYTQRFPDFLEKLNVPGHNGNDVGISWYKIQLYHKIGNGDNLTTITLDFPALSNSYFNIGNNTLVPIK
jgi:hypothetical protein